MSELSEKVCAAIRYLMAVPGISLFCSGAVNPALLMDTNLFTCHY